MESNMPNPPVLQLQDKDEEAYTLYPTLSLKKKIFVDAMVATFGNIGQSCKLARISRSTYKRWLELDEDFATVIKEGEFEEMALDFAENKLMSLIEDKNVQATMFYLKTKGKKRGYVEKTELKAPLPMDKEPSWFAPEEVPKLPEQTESGFITDADFTMVPQTDKIQTNEKATSWSNSCVDDRVVDTNCYSTFHPNF